MKNLLVTTGYTRSGNTYLNFSLRALYYPNEEPRLNLHSAAALHTYDKLLVPIRTPLECISSWHNYPAELIDEYQFERNLEEDINYYIRFHNEVITNKHKVVIMDFDLFTKDLEYIKSKVMNNFGILTQEVVTDAQVKEAMLFNNKGINLPQNNKNELNAVKFVLETLPEFQECLDVYAQLKVLSAS
jgi:cellulose biosynthesis protein BcsQ